MGRVIATRATGIDIIVVSLLCASIATAIRVPPSSSHSKDHSLVHSSTLNKVPIVDNVGPIHPLSPGNVTLKDDAYHFNPAIKKEKLWYTEWWYLNFDCGAKQGFNPSTDPDIAGIYVYGVWDPGNVLGVGQTIEYSIHYNGNTTSQTNDLRSEKEFTASYDEANVTIANSQTLRVINETTYHLVGQSQNGNNKWDLTWSAQTSPMFFYEDSPAAGTNDKWQRISWLVYMPRAFVNGQVTTKGQTYSVENCPGYHDHDWGYWFSFGMKWAWINFSTKDIALVGGAAAKDGSSPANNVWLRFANNPGVTQKFVANMSSVTYSDFVSSDIPLHKYPRHAVFTSHNDQYKLDLQWTVRLSPGIWKSAVVVFEQQSDITATVTPMSNGVVDVSAAQTFTGRGFTEWTDLLL